MTFQFKKKKKNPKQPSKLKELKLQNQTEKNFSDHDDTISDFSIQQSQLY